MRLEGLKVSGGVPLNRTEAEEEVIQDMMRIKHFFNETPFQAIKSFF